jgi:hypothetical protein
VAEELDAGGTALFAAHEQVRYAETAALLDATEEERITGFRETLAGFLGDRDHGEVSLWRAERIPDAPASAGPSGSPGSPGSASGSGSAPGLPGSPGVPLSPGDAGRTGAGTGR